MENPETPRGKLGELTPGGPTADEAARVSRGELIHTRIGMRNHSREVSIRFEKTSIRSVGRCQIVVWHRKSALAARSPGLLGPNTL
jgi:hypothetical protein